MTTAKLPRFRLNDFLVDPHRNTISTGADEISVQAKIMEVLLVLSIRPNETVTKETLIEQVWQGNEYVGKQGITRSISVLRSIFQDSTAAPQFIETIPRRGYRLLVSPRPIESGIKSRKLSAAIASLAVLLVIGLMLFGTFGLQEEPSFGIQATSLSFVSLLPGSESAPSISAKGSLAYNHEVNGSHKLIVTKDWADASDSRELLEANQPFSPLWSPKGTRLAVSNEEQHCQIMMFNTHLSLERTLYCDAGTHNVITWLTDTTLLYINAAGVFATYEAAELNNGFANKDLIRALNLLPTHPNYLAYHENNGKIALFLPIDMQNHRLMLLSKNGTILSGPELYQAAKGLSWLDENSVLVSSRIRGRFALSQVNTKTWQRTPFQLAGGYEARFPSTCSGCQHLALERFSLGSRLTQLNLDDSETRSVTKMHGSRYERFPVQHAEGGLAFVMNDGQSDALYVIPPGTSEPIKLNMDKHLRIIYPSWANSGKQIAFLGGDDTGTNVYSISLKNPEVIKHTVRGTFGPPKFSLDDRYIYSGKFTEDNQWHLHAIDQSTNNMASLPIHATMAVPVSGNTFLSVTLEQPDIFLTDTKGNSRKFVELPPELLGAWTYQDGMVTFLKKEGDWHLVQMQVDNGSIIHRYELPALSLLDLQTITFDDNSLIFVERITENSEVIVASLQ